MNKIMTSIPGKNKRSKNLIVFIQFAFICLLTASPLPASAAQKDTVVILHGIAKSAASMQLLEKALQDQNYDTLSLTYPSTDHNLDGLAGYLESKHLTKAFWDNAGRVHFVTHSMGGLVVRRYLDHYRNGIPLEKLGRVVMLAPPNGGSEVADTIHKLPPYKWYYGPAGDELTTAVQARTKSNVYYDLGIIAGRKEWPYIVARFIVPGESDGRVSVKNTRLKGMKDHIIVNGTHTFIMDRPDVHKHIAHFLKNGAFRHEE